MGTAVISVVFTGLGADLWAQIFLVVALLVALPVLGLTTWRCLRFPRAVAADLSNPVKGALFATFPGGFLVLATALGRAGQLLFGSSAAIFLTYLFATVGALLALAIGLWFLSDIFSRGGAAPPQITGAWFIPPVVTIIVPTALAPILTSPALYWLCWAFFGIGSLLYLIVLASLFFRSATAPFPPALLAPTLIIGMGPAGLLATNLVLLSRAGERLGLGGLGPIGQVGAVSFWAFGLWWGLVSVLTIARAHRRLPYALTWWSFTFPLGAWVSSGLTIDVSFIRLTSTVGAVLLLLVWLTVVVFTGRDLVRSR